MYVYSDIVIIMLFWCERGYDICTQESVIIYRWMSKSCVEGVVQARKGVELMIFQTRQIFVG